MLHCTHLCLYQKVYVCKVVNMYKKFRILHEMVPKLLPLQKYGFHYHIYSCIELKNKYESIRLYLAWYLYDV